MHFHKETSYFQHIRSDLLALIPNNKKIERVLEIGCGDGSTGNFLKRYLGVKEIVGIEVNEAVKEEAEKKLDKVIIANIEEVELSFEQDYFDCLLLADVLEHLFDPWSVLKKLRPFIKKEGAVLASVPNIQHWSIFFDLLKGRWEYKKEGILDNTHIRFFTRKTIKAMFIKSGYQVEKIKSTMGKEVRLINCLTLGMFSGFLSYRYLISAKKE